MSNKENTGLNLFPANEEHIESLYALQKAFLRYSAPSSNELNIAFEVTNDPLSEDDFREIVTRNECVILFDGNVPVGYMLIDTCSKTRGFQQYHTAIGQLVKEDILSSESINWPRYLEILNPQLYHEQFDEVRWQMLATLIYMNREKYDGFCFVFFTNADTLLEKLNLGWKVAFDNGIYYFLFWDFDQLNETPE